MVERGGTPPSGDADLHPWPAPFDQPFYVLLNLAVGGNFDGNPDATTPSAAEMRVDYVRVYGLEAEKQPAGQRPRMTYPWTPVPARPALPDGNLVYNPSFDWADTDPRVTPGAPRLEGVSGSAFWTLFTSDGKVTLSSDTAADNALKADITAPGSVNYAVQVRQDGLNVEAGGKYEVSFEVWAAQPRAMMVKVGGGPNRGYAAYSGEQTVQIGTAKARRTLTFDMKAVTDAAARLEFNLGNAGVGPVWLDNVVVKRVGNAAGARPRPVTATSCTTRALPRTAPPTPALRACPAPLTGVPGRAARVA
ncbi:carbohydrate binding domain-containing protein [Deinococcus multiflagellatus]|uniref:Carbohydrate binding domain-containing protein n=1 Tax=Deinococcus multiflagellatus TaxID=1656887 RepID=A0ABW1ZHN8_9DEIO